jgi:hypothetical protein
MYAARAPGAVWRDLAYLLFDACAGHEHQSRGYTSSVPRAATNEKLRVSAMILCLAAGKSRLQHALCVVRCSFTHTCVAPLALYDLYIHTYIHASSKRAVGQPKPEPKMRKRPQSSVSSQSQARSRVLLAEHRRLRLGEQCVHLVSRLLALQCWCYFCRAPV